MQWTIQVVVFVSVVSSFEIVVVQNGMVLFLVVEFEVVWVVVMMMM